jgi:hypothetical protein
LQDTRWYAPGPCFSAFATERPCSKLFAQSALREIHDQPKVAEGKYDFLRTSEAFKKAMTIAADRYSWSKKSF